MKNFFNPKFHIFKLRLSGRLTINDEIPCFVLRPEIYLGRFLWLIFLRFLIRINLFAI